MLYQDNIFTESSHPVCTFKKLDSDSIKNSPNGEWELDLINQTLSWSNNQYAIYGYKPNELKLNSEFFLFKTTHFTEIERIKKIIDDAIKYKSEYSFRRKIVKKGGKIGFAETNASIIRSETGQALKIKGITIDVGGQEANCFIDYNDPQFFNDFYSKYKKAVLYEISKITHDRDLSEDLCQETYIKAWKKISQYDPQKGEFYTWIINIAKNHCKDHLRSKYHTLKKDSVRIDLLSDKKLNVFSDNVENIDIRALLNKLPADLGEIINMLFFHGYTHEELALIKGMPLGTVKTKSRRAIKILRQGFAFSQC